MGDRSNIAIKYRSGETIYLYGHWLGKENLDIVQEAIAEGHRLDDEAYFARILFSKMVRNDIFGTTGFGIAPYMPDNDYGNPLVTVDFSQSPPTVEVEGWDNPVPLTEAGSLLASA